MYRIKYWYQETPDSDGFWCTTGVVSYDAAMQTINSGIFQDASIFPDDEYKTCRNCSHRVGEDCEQHGGKECYMEDVCDQWGDKNI